MSETEVPDATEALEAIYATMPADWMPQRIDTEAGLAVLASYTEEVVRALLAKACPECNGKETCQWTIAAVAAAKDLGLIR